ncbi:hypothetical protein KIW84_043327 [Lathyrus oleraceus]|uniref:H15 domain-containing protein n=1 Tax=Pisum sativum TaxID=3888 RepID=A0A9D4XEX2_PEA|nr:hypothetical protein KIW84_043327 [Pisum sativum]
MALDTLNTTVVSPIYYALFTLFTILAGAIMFKDYSGQSMSSIASELCGFITVLSGTTVLHCTRIPDPPVSTDVYSPLSPKLYQHYKHNEEQFWRIQQQHKNQMQNLFDKGLYSVFLLKDQEWNLWCRTVVVSWNSISTEHVIPSKVTEYGSNGRTVPSFFPWLDYATKYPLSELFKARPPLWNTALQSESFDDDEFEHFEDVIKETDKEPVTVSDKSDEPELIQQMVLKFFNCGINHLSHAPDRPSTSECNTLANASAAVTHVQVEVFIATKCRLATLPCKTIHKFMTGIKYQTESKTLRPLCPKAWNVQETEPKKDSKPRNLVSHPTYEEMIKDAIVSLKEKNGSSQYAIVKFIKEKQKQLPGNFKKLLLQNLKKNVAFGKLAKVKGSFKLSAAAKKPAVAKPKSKPG